MLFTGRAAAVEHGVPHPALTGYSERFRAREQRLVDAAATDVRGAPRDRGRHRLLAGLRRGRQGRRRHRRDARAVRARRPRGREDRRRAAGVRGLSAARRGPSRSVPLARGPRRRVAARLPQGRDQLLRVSVRDARAVRRRGREHAHRGRVARRLARARGARTSRARSTQAVGLLPRPLLPRALQQRHRAAAPRARAARRGSRARVEQDATPSAAAAVACCRRRCRAIADQMAKRRLAEVQAAGGGMVVTSCATCTFMLKRNAPPSVEVANLATAMAQLSETPFTVPDDATVRPGRRRMTNPLVDDRDVELILDEVLDARAPAPALPDFAEHERETFDCCSTPRATLAREVLFPAYRALDAEPPRARRRPRAACTRACASSTRSWSSSASSPRRGPPTVGGQQLPLTVFSLATAYLMAGEPVGATATSGSRRARRTCSRRSAATRCARRTWRRMYRGEWTGTMALTEPQAGSSLADVTTTRDADGRRPLPDVAARRSSSPAAITISPRTSCT